MVYVITSRGTDFKSPIYIKVPTREFGDQPYLGFISQELGDAYLRLKNFINEDFYVAPIDEILGEDSIKRDIFVYEYKQQIVEAEKDTEGYNYERLIRRYDLITSDSSGCKNVQLN